MSDQLIPSAGEGSNPVGEAASYISEQMAQLCAADSDYSLDDAEEKAKLISQVCKAALIAAGKAGFFSALFWRALTTTRRKFELGDFLAELGQNFA